jgi:pimeloyl-ACP methyl ester carboxylesterase
MPRAALPSGIEIEYDTFGSPEDPALLLIMGFTAQLISWDEGFCRLLADGGRYVIRFDNRDCGLSTTFDGVEIDLGQVIAAAVGGQPLPEVPYTLSDMAADAVGLLDHLGTERAHVLGASMGGMIAQTVAIEHPSRVASLISVMSMTGELEYGQPTPEAMAVLMTPPPPDRDGVVASAAASAVWSSRRWFDLARAEENYGRSYDRRFYPQGAPRQFAAIYASGPRTDTLPTVTAPTLVIHGLDDTLITPSGGERTAELIPGASLLLVADMGHDMPVPLWPLLTGAILGFTATVIDVAAGRAAGDTSMVVGVD